MRILSSRLMTCIYLWWIRYRCKIRIRSFV
nr:MAG TPA: hypothetical protein [Caudoviricetes sp.]